VSRRTSVVWVVLVVLVLALLGAAIVRHLRDRSGGLVAGSGGNQEVDISHLQVGDCVFDVVTTDQDTRLPEVPCSQPHKGEVVGQFRPTGAYPGDLRIPEGVHDHCRQLFEAYAPDHAADRGFSVFFSLASRRQWSDENYRFTCVATDFTFRTGRLTDPARPNPVSTRGARTFLNGVR
jgi:Septum formation